jgi:hypothetical protein
LTGLEGKVDKNPKTAVMTLTIITFTSFMSNYLLSPSRSSGQ